jgi:hypothetical protein
MAKMLRGMDGDYDLAGTKGRKKKSKKKTAKKAAKRTYGVPKGFKIVSRDTCLHKTGKKKGKLKKGCTWGRGKLKGKFLKKVA